MKARTIILALVAVGLGIAAYLTYREPPTEKAERLRGDMTVACVGVRYAAELERVASPEERAKCDVATREYNQFMAGN